jgi:uncharacterized protein (DUF2342 family)
MDLAWSEPANVPSIAEIREPQLWIDRVRASSVAA